MTNLQIDDALRAFLDGSAWVAGLTPSQMDRVRHDVAARAYANGATVCAAGTPSNQWLGVVDGMLKVETISVDGKSATFAGVPAGAIFDTMELTEDADFEQRGIMQRMEHPTIGPFKMPGWPVRFGGRTPEVKPSPLLGQHTSEVLSEWLGLDADQIDQLGKDKII